VTGTTSLQKTLPQVVFQKSEGRMRGTGWPRFTWKRPLNGAAPGVILTLLPVHEPQCQKLGK